MIWRWKYQNTTHIGIVGIILIAIVVVLFFAAHANCPHGCSERSFGCGIKGNITAAGKKIYHVWNDKYYDQTIINPERGEMYFCTEEEARDNGFRRALVP